MTKAKKSKEDEYKKKIEELTDDLKRLQAEFENFKKRCEKDSADFRKYSDSKIIEEMLPIIDTFDIAVGGNNHDDEFSKGIKLIHKQMHDFLKKKGLKPILCKGQKFDPYYHEVMLSVEGNDDGVVLEELQKGYMLHEKVLRHSKVKVCKKRDGCSKKQKQGE